MQELIERISPFMMHEMIVRDLTRRCLLFNETFWRGQIGISKFTVKHTVKRFGQTSSIKNHAKLGRLASTTSR